MFIVGLDIPGLTPLEDISESGDYHVVVALYTNDGSVIQPAPAVDYLAASDKMKLGQEQSSP